MQSEYIKLINDPSIIRKLPLNKVCCINPTMVKHLPFSKVKYLNTKEQISELNNLALTFIHTSQLKKLTNLQKLIYAIESLTLFIFGLIAIIPLMIGALSASIYSKEKAKKLRDIATHSLTNLPRAAYTILKIS
jgi:hypothetical protein